MAVSQRDHPNFSSQGNLHSGCEQMPPSELTSPNIDAPSWSTTVDSTHENLWPRFPILNSRVPPTQEVEEWSSCPHPESNSRSAATVLLDLGSGSAIVPSVQSVENVTSREQSPQTSVQLATSDCKSIESDRVSRRATAFVTGVTRSPTVGSETRSPVGRSMEHLTGLNFCDEATFPKFSPMSCIGDTGGVLHNKRAVSAYYGIPSPIKPSVSQSALTTSSVSVVDEERGLHQPDGADQPDEHMWLYEDPQGRTQGTFSDAQMHDWLSEGIYFTESLRVRRKCDDSFSTLAQYCQLFGRIPFHSGPRVSPIIGGITPSMVVSSAHAERCSPSGPSVNHQLRSVGHGPGITGFSSSIGGHIASMDGLSPSATNTSGSSSLTAYQRSPYKLDQESGAHYPIRRGFPSSTVEEERAPVNKLGSGIYFNSSLPVAQNRAPPFLQARAPLMPHDVSSLGLSSMSPGFLSALAQYLSPNSNPATTTSGTSSSSTSLTTGTSVSPLQHLAETAQLAAQLAAMAGAHSPDQTPMQPSQALALAEMLICSHLSPSNWPPQQSKREGFTPSGGAAAAVGLPTEFRTDQSGGPCVAVDGGGGNELLHSQAAAGFHLRGGLADDALLKQPAWSAIAEALEKSDIRVSCDGDGALTKASRDTTTTSNSSNKQRLADSSKYNLPGSSQKFPQNKVFRPTNGCGDLSNSASVTSPGNHGKREGQLSFADSLQRSPNSSHLTTPGKRTVGGSGTTDSISNDSNFPAVDHMIATKMSPSSRTHADVENDGKKQVSNKGSNKDDRKTTVNGPYRTGSSNVPPKGGVNLSKAGPTLTLSCADHLQSPLKFQASQSDPSELTPDVPSMSELSVAAEEELELLTQWSIGRLNSLPMREKVDIPTVVELLATLDAPYEVERMVSTFLGESSRVAQFVKDFLDHRRPFWKLHRQLRENSIVVVGQSAASLTAAVVGNHANNGVASGGASTTLSGERSMPSNTASSTITTSGGKKKKRTSAGGGNTGGVTAAVGTVNSTSNHVLKRQSTAGGDSSTDNQWHHIRPKSNHHRKANKGIDRKVAS